MGGPYIPDTITNGVTPINKTIGDHFGTQAGIALHAFNGDEIGAGFVLYGCQCAKDPSTANKLNIFAGRAYTLMTDGTLGCIVVATSSQTTASLNATYNLYLQPDGTFYWSTSNSPAANSLKLATVTTDGSGNISGVTDNRVLNFTLYPGSTGQAGTLYLPTSIGMVKTQNNALNGTVNGTVTFGQGGALLAGGDYNTAATFNGTTGFISCPPGSLPTGNGAFSIEVWLKFASNPASAQVVATFGTSGGTTNAPQIYIDNAGKSHVGWAGGTDAISNANLSTAAYHHVVMTWDGTTMKQYVDGSVQTATTTPGAQTTGSTFCTIGAGSATGSTANFFAGQLDEVAIYNTALSAARVTAHYNAATTTAGGYLAAVQADSPLRHYRLGDAVGSAYAVDTIASTNATLFDPGGALTAVGASSLTGGILTLPGSSSIDTSGNEILGGSLTATQFNGINQYTYIVPKLSGASGGLIFQAWDGAAQQSPFGVGNGTGVATYVKANGAIGAINSQATAGSFGVPVIVAQTVRTHVTATTLQSILTYAVTTSGVYRVSAYFSLKNSVSGQNITLDVTTVDPDDTFGGATIYMWGSSGVLLNGSTAIGNNDYAAQTILVNGKTGNNIVVEYRDPANTPNDYVTAIIERIA